MNFKLNTKIVLLISAILICLSILFPGSALAQTSSNITGQWNATANDTVGVLNITQFNNGFISGNIFGQRIQGTYVPSTRRLVFARDNASGDPFQLYSGWVSGSGRFLAGTFHAWNGSGGADQNGGDFGFWAIRETDGNGDGNGEPDSGREDPPIEPD
ncbi:MAG: hypothetical protein AB4426_10475 [Xenococcaceae cyanobacterium]